MSIAAPSIPSIKIKTSSPHPCPRLPLRPLITTIRSSQAEGPVRRPTAPSLSPPPPLPSSPPTVSPPPPAVPALAVAAAKEVVVVTLEFQRKAAKELQDYFKQKKLEEANQGPFFGFIPKNEISNGRYSLN